MTIVNHKVNRNTIKLPGAYSVEDEESVPDPTLRYDNDFVSHPIPSTEFRYRWISEALWQDDDRSQFYPYRYFTVPSELANELISYSNIHLYDFEYVKTPYVPFTTRHANTEGLTFRYKVVDNVIQPGDEYGTVPVGDKIGYTNYYLSTLNGPYHWPSWKQIRSSENPILKISNKNARVAISDPITYSSFNNSLVKPRRSPSNTVYFEPPFDTSFYSLEHSVEEIIREDLAITNIVRYSYDFANYRVFFATKDLDLKLGFNENLTTFYDDIYLHYSVDFTGPVNDFYRIKYTELVWPKRQYTGTSLSRDRPYFVLNWRDDREDRTRTDSQNSQGETLDYDSMWPLDSRPVISIDSNNFSAQFDDTIMSTTASSENRGNVGELNSLSNKFHYGTTSLIKPSVCFTNPNIDYSPSAQNWGPIFSNDTEFRIPRQVNLKPFSDSYEDWNNEVRIIGKDYSKLTEFRISEKIQEYVDENGLNFLSGSDYFEASGTFSSYIKKNNLESSYEEETYHDDVFLQTQILTNFARIREDHKNLASPTKLKLEVDAIMKFTPYEGFYPAERAVEISTIFSQSYAENIIFSGSSADYRTVLAPLFSPGILFNSIKAGIGYAQPLVRVNRTDGNILVRTFGTQGTLERNVAYAGGNASKTTKALTVYPGSPSSDYHSDLYKLPFEAILDPEKYLSDQYAGDQVIHPSGSFITSNVVNSSFKLASGDPKYKLAINNFLAESVDFFLENNNLSILTSADDNDPQYFNFKLNKEYKMRVYLRNSEKYDELSLFKEMASAGLTNYSGTFTFDQDLSSPNNILTWSKVASNYIDPRYFSKPTTEMMYRPFFNYDTLQGLPNNFASSTMIFGNFLNWDGSLYGDFARTYLEELYVTASVYSIGNFGRLRYDHVTPPYMQGYTFVEYTFRPFGSDGTWNASNTGTKRFTLQEVMNNLSSSYFRFSEDPIKEYLRFRDAGDYVPTDDLEIFAFSGSDYTLSFESHANETLRIDDAVKLTERVKNKLVEYDENGNVISVKDDTTAGERWVIYPSWETPIYDFYPISADTPDLGISDEKEKYYYRKSFSSSDAFVMSGNTNQAVGLWYDYAKHYDDSNSDNSFLGRYPSGKDGLFLEVKEVPKQYIDLVQYDQALGFDDPTFQTALPTFEEDTSESLADAVGFSNRSVKLGKLNKKKIIKEAVVMIPYLNLDGRKEFIKLKDGSPKIKEISDKMDNYVIPPKFNFSQYNGNNNTQKIDPIAMYIFEFEYELDLEDVSRIWQNVSPKSQILSKKVSIEHDFKDDEILEVLLDDKIQWLVFKVKQKAKWAYKDKIVSSINDDRYNFDFSSGGADDGVEYSYNWPYDFCSVIDSAKIKAEILIETEKAQEDRNRELKLVQQQSPIDSIKKFASKTLKEQAESVLETAPSVNDYINNAEVITVNDQGTLQEQQTVQQAVANNNNSLSSNAPTSNPILKTDANTLLKKLRS